MNTATLALLVLASPVPTAPPVQEGHAGLHPAEALLFVELPDVPAAWERAPEAPLARLVLDERVQAAVEGLSGQPLSAWLARPELAGVLEPIGGFTQDLAAVSVSLGTGEPGEVVEPGHEPLLEVALEAVLEYGSAERATAALDGLARLLEGAAHLELRIRDGDPAGLVRFGDERAELFAWVDGRRVRVGLGRTDHARMQARSRERSLAGSRTYGAAAERLTDRRGTTTLRGAWRPGSTMLRNLAERAGEVGEAEARRLEELAGLLGGHFASPESLLAFQMRQVERGFLWESFQADAPEGAAPPLRELAGRVPADAVAAWLTSVDASFWWEVAALADDTGSIARWSREAAAAEIDVEGDLFGQLGPGLALYLPPPGGLALPRAQAWVELRDAEAFGRARDAIVRRAAEHPAAEGGVEVVESTYRDTRLTTFKPASGPLQPTLAVIDGELLLMLQPSHMKRFLRDRAKAERAAGDADEGNGSGELGEPASFAERADVAPRLSALGDAQSLMFVDWGEILGGYYRTAMAFAQLAGAGGVELDLELLPPPEIFPEHLRPTWRVARRVAGGTHVLRESSFGPEVPLALVGGAALVVPQVMTQVGGR